MALAIAASNTYTDNVGLTSHPVNLPTGIASGNLLLMFGIFNSTPTVTTPTGWTLLASGTTPATYDTIKLFAKIASGSEGATETVALSAANRASVITYRITGNRNGVTSSEIAVSAVNEEGSGINHNPPSLTPTWGAAENLWFAIAFCNDGSMTWSAYPASYTLGQNAVNTGSGTGNAVAAAARLLNTATEDPGTFTTVTSRQRSSFTLAIRSSAAASLVVDSGSYAITGTAATPRPGRKVAADAGSYALTGAAATPKLGRKIAAAAGSYALTGTAASLLNKRRITAAAGSYTITGTAASPKYGYRITAGPGSYLLTGTAATMLRTYRLAALAGSYAITGTAVALALGARFTVEGGSYVVTGSSVSLVYRPQEYISPGQERCMRCGFVKGRSQMRKEWTGLLVCEDTCWEPRHPQMSLRGVPDRQNLPWTRPEPEPVFIDSTGVTGDDL